MAIAAALDSSIGTVRGCRVGFLKMADVVRSLRACGSSDI